MPFPLDSPFRGRGGAVSGLRGVDLPSLVEVLEGSQVAGSPAGNVGRGSGHGPRADFFQPAVSGVNIARSRTSGLCLSRKPDTSTQPSPQVNMTAPESFPIFGMDSIHIRKVPIYDRYRKISGRADNGKLIATLEYASPREITLVIPGMFMTSDFPLVHHYLMALVVGLWGRNQGT